MTCHITPTGGDLRANIEGLLKKFRVTKENEKEGEIFTLANLDNGCIRKFIVKKVDESAFLASINRRNKEDSKSLTDENENTAVVGSEEGGDACPLVPPSPKLPRRNGDVQPIANGHVTLLERKSSSNFKLGCDDDSDDYSSMTVDDKDDPGALNPAFAYEEEEDDDLGRGDGSTTSARSSPDTSPSRSPKLNFSSMSPRPSPRQSPVSHRSGNLSHRSSVSSVRKGILKKSGSSSTINMEMVNLGLQNAAIAAGNAANLNGYQRARFTDPYDDNYVPMDTHRFVGSSEENNYMMQQKSLGGHRVKFILETGKPDHVHGSYDDIRIEKMERERIERIESGKNLEVTNMTDRGGKKCLLFCAAMLVLTGAVIVAGLYGSGKLKKITEYGQGISSGLSGGAGSNIPSTGVAFIAYVPNSIEVKFKIESHDFTSDLTDVESETYKTMVKNLEGELKKILFPEPVLHNGKAILNLKIIKFEPGSIRCTFRIGWSYYDEENKQEAPLNLTVIKEIFENKINDSYIYLHEEYRVSPDSIVVDRLVDKCHNNQSLCSNGCKFSYEDLRFTCTCPDSFILINTTTCVFPNNTARHDETTAPNKPIELKVDDVIKLAGNATIVGIKLDYVGSEVVAPPTKKETQEETDTIADSEADKQPKPEEGTVDATASNVTVNATTEGEPSPINVTDSTTNTNNTARHDETTAPNKPIADTVEDIIKLAGNETIVDIKLDYEGSGVVAPPTKKETQEETDTIADSEADKQPKPEEGTVDATASNVTVIATTEGEPSPINVTDSTTNTSSSTTTTTSTTTMSPTTVSPALNETVTEVIPGNTTEAANITLTSTTTTTTTTSIETNTSITNATTHEPVSGQEEQQTTTTEKPITEVTSTPEPVKPVHSEPQSESDGIFTTTLKAENTSVVAVTETTTTAQNETTVTSDPASVITTTEPTIEKETEIKVEHEEAAAPEESVIPEKVTNTTHHSNVSLSMPEVNGNKSEIPLDSYTNTSALFPEVFVSPGTRLEDILSFTNLPDKPVIVLDLSALTPGDSPGNEGFQTVEDRASDVYTIANETKISVPAKEKSPAHSSTTPDTDTKHTVNETTTKETVAGNVTESPTPTTQPTEKPVVIVNSNEVAEHEDNIERETEEEVLKEVVTIPAVPYEGNPIFANKTPPPVRTTTTTTTTTTPAPSTTTTPTTTTATTPTTTTVLTTTTSTTPVAPTTQPSVLNGSVTTQVTTTTTQDYDTKGEEAPVDNPQTSIMDIAFIANSDLSTMARNVSSNEAPATTTTTTTTTTTAATTITEGSTNSSKAHDEAAESSSTAKDKTTDDSGRKVPESLADSASAPPKIVCHEDQVECLNGTSTWGRCIPRSSRCNSVPDCSDASDELDCKENSCFGNFQCQDGKCMERMYVCDGITNCWDGDDELNCESWQCKEDELKCGASVPSPCIPMSLRCNGQPDCVDHSDELNCTEECGSDEFRCSEGWCIPDVWTCDGRADCYGGEDEKNCGCSSEDLTPCAVGGCVPIFQLCDGLRQCRDGSDEWHCVRVDNGTRQLEIRSGKSRWSAVCGEGWTSQWSDLVCEQLGATLSVSTEVSRVEESVPRPRVKLSPKASAQAYTPLQFVLKSDCSSVNLVHLSCAQHSCGSWSLGNDVQEEHQLSAGAQPLAPEGQWPSLALLVRTHPNKNDTPAHGQYCSASIVAPSWVLAAYSCIYSKENGLDPATWAVVSGMASLMASTKFHYVIKIVHFPGVVRTGGLWTGDAVLLRLDHPLVLGPDTQPVCLPDAPPRNIVSCVAAGWTRTHEGLGSQSQFVHHLPKPTLTPDACNTTHYPGRLSPSHSCFDFPDLQHPPCHGDEGTPLMCRSESGAWHLEGLLTHHTLCGRAHHPAVFTALHALQPWLSNTIGTPYVPNLTSISTTTTTTTSTTTTPTTTTAASTTTTSTTTSATTSHSTTTTTPSIPIPADSNGVANSTDLKEVLPPLSSPGKAPL